MDSTLRRRLRLSTILIQLCDSEAARFAEEMRGKGESASESASGSSPAGTHQIESDDRDTCRVSSFLTVGEIIDRTSHAGFGFLLGFLALVSVPFFGLSLPFGLAVAFVAAQMVFGKSRPWLPKSIRRRQVRMVTIHWLSTRVARWSAGLEKVVRPRFGFLVRGPFWSAVGVAVMIQGLGLALPIPIPGSNWVFVVPVMIYGIGLLEDDGILILIGHAITVGELTFLVHAWNAVVESMAAIWS